MAVENIERRFRLRNGEKIVGFMRKVTSSMVLYSTDGFWWRGHKIEYSDLDEFTGLRDKNDKHLYEWDLVNYKIDPDGAYHKGAILWENRQKIFGIKDLAMNSFIPLSVDGVLMFNQRQLEVFSYLFINPSLKKKLGVRD